MNAHRRTVPARTARRLANRDADTAGRNAPRTPRPTARRAAIAEQIA